MEKKLSASLIDQVDESLYRLTQDWEELKKVWHSDASTAEGLDKAFSFYKFIDTWLATDRLMDQEMHVHTLTPWNDLALQPVRQAINSLQARLSKIDDPERKRREINNLEEILKTTEF